jgi:hypothetical protein
MLTGYSAATIRHLEEEPGSESIPHIYYYFNFRDPSTQTCQNFLLSLLSQLFHFLPETPPAIEQLFTRHNSGTRTPSVKDLTQCLLDVINGLVEVRLFGDAFDECDEWNNLWHFLSKVVAARCPSLRFLFTSRPEQNIRDAVNALDIPSINLVRKETNKDIEKVIVESLENNPRYAKISFEGKNMVIESLATRARGM